jgi:leucyl-tRNA synthetase
MICKKSSTDGKLYKMSKSKGNVVSPDALIQNYGADTLRLYTLFIGPPEKDAEWSDQGIEGSSRFLRRLWRRVYDTREWIASATDLSCDIANMDGPERDLYRKLHETIDHVTRDVEGAFHFNSAIAQIMELTNAMDDTPLTADSSDPHRAVFRTCTLSLLRLLAPFAPHIAEELWQVLGNDTTILKAGWPEVNREALSRDEVEMVVQINGKVRDRITVPAEMPSDQVEALAMQAPGVQRNMQGLQVRKVIVIPGKLINIAASA